MIRSKKFFMLFCIIILSFAFTGCALIQLPFQMLGTAVGAAGKAAQVGMAAAPYAAPFLL